MTRPEQSVPDPFTSLDVGAAQTHEMFTAYMRAGFTRAEALQLVGEMLAANVRASVEFGLGGGRS